MKTSGAAALGREIDTIAGDRTTQQETVQ